MSGGVRRRSVRSSVVAFLLLTLAIACRNDGSPVRAVAAPTVPPSRIVSMAPGLTETLFALGVGDRVVGVTDFCAFPAEVGRLPRVGGYLDPNYERIIELRPDLVVLMQSHTAVQRRLASFDIASMAVDQHDVRGVIDSIVTIADACGVPDEGVALATSIEERLDRLAKAVTERPVVRAVVVVGRDAGAGMVRSVWAAGPDTFYDDLLTILGASNALTGGIVRYPELSREGLADLDPDVILDVVAGMEDRGFDVEDVRAQWSQLVELRAVRRNRVHVLEGDVMVVPGPRLPEMAERMASAIHPDLALGGSG